MSSTKQTVVPLSHYQCPDCGISDQDTGYHGQTHMIYCEVCLDGSQYVRLKRRQVDYDAIDHSPDGSGADPVAEPAR